MIRDRKPKRSIGWVWLRVTLYLVVGAVAAVDIRFRAYGIERQSQWARAPFLTATFGWAPDGRLAIDAYSKTDAFFVGRMYWKLQILDPSVVEDLASELEFDGERSLEARTGISLPWWPSEAETVGGAWSRCDRDRVICRGLWYDAKSGEAYLSWEAG